MRRRDGLSVIDVLATLGALAALAGATYGFVKFGILGAVAGIPVGFVAGGVASAVVCVVLVIVLFAVLTVGAYLKGGRAGVRELFRESPDGPAADSTTAGDCHGDG